MNNKENTIEYDKPQEPIVVSKITSDILLKQEKPAELMALYWFYYYTAKWQGTNQPKVTTSYVAEGLKWGKDKIIKAKKQLIDLNLIEDKITRNKNTGKINGHYIVVKFIWWNNNKILQTSCLKNTRDGKTLPLVKSDTNALNTNILNSLNTNNKSLDLSENKALKTKEIDCSNLDVSKNETSFKNNITSINNIISFWNDSLPETRKHKPDTKLYNNISLHINNLLNGLPLIKKKDNTVHKKYLEYLKENYISSRLYTKTWTETEIMDVLQVFYDNQSAKSRKSKLSLDIVFWNEFVNAKSGKMGWSHFMFIASLCFPDKEDII